MHMVVVRMVILPIFLMLERMRRSLVNSITVVLLLLLVMGFNLLALVKRCMKLLLLRLLLLLVMVVLKMNLWRHFLG
jgi:hypothetical protein